jgi:ADP-heptose:LPS heptosyltransferase
VLHVPEDALSRASLFLREQAPGAARWVCFNTGGSGRWKEKRWRPEHYLGLAAIVAAEEPGTRILLRPISTGT